MVWMFHKYLVSFNVRIFRNYLKPLWIRFIIIQSYKNSIQLFKICIVESSSTSLNKNKIFWPFVTPRMNIMLWLISKTSTLAKRKFSWWAKKRWILQSQFRRGRGKSYLFDIFFRKSKGPNLKNLIHTLRFQFKRIGKCWTSNSSLF